MAPASLLALLFLYVQQPPHTVTPHITSLSQQTNTQKDTQDKSMDCFQRD